MYSNKYQSINQAVSMSVSKQKGFVLVLSLVMLAMLTLIGVSSMNRSILELRASANARHYKTAFNAAQSVLAFSIEEKEIVDPPLIDWTITDPDITQLVPYSLTDIFSVSSTVKFIGCAKSIGDSLEEGKGFSNNYHVIEGTGTDSTGSSTSIQSQGVRNVAAAC